MDPAVQAPPVMQPPPAVPYYPLPRRQRKPRVWPAYVFAVFILVHPIGLALVIGITVVIVGAMRHLSDKDVMAILEDARVLFGVTTLMLLVNLALALAFQWTSRYLKPHLPLFRRPRAGPVSIGMLALGGMAIAILSTMALDVMNIPSPSLESITRSLGQMRHMPPTLWEIPLVPVLLIGVIGPFAEEVVFRGVIQPRLVRRHGPWWGIFITSLFFALYHWDVGQGLLAVFTGMYLGFVAYRTRSIWPAFLAHMLVNTSSSVFVFKGLELPDNLYSVGLAGVLALLSAGGIFVLVRVPHLRRARPAAP